MRNPKVESERNGEPTAWTTTDEWEEMIHGAPSLPVKTLSRRSSKVTVVVPMRGHRGGYHIRLSFDMHVSGPMLAKLLWTFGTMSFLEKIGPYVHAHVFRNKKRWAADLPQRA